MITLTRPATAEETAIHTAVETAFASFSDDDYMTIYETVTDYIFSFGDEHKTAYGKVYRLGKKYGFSVEDLTTWACIEED